MKRRGVCRFHTGIHCAEKMGGWNIRHVYRLIGPIAVLIRESPTNSQEAINITSIFENCSSSTARRGGCHSALSRTIHDEGAAAVWSSQSQLTLNLNRRLSDGITDMKDMTSLQVFKTTVLYRFERKELSIRQRPGRTGTRRKEI
jgi:hypothetical protein